MEDSLLGLRPRARLQLLSDVLVGSSQCVGMVSDQVEVLRFASYIVEVSEDEDHSNRRIKAFTTAPWHSTNLTCEASIAELIMIRFIVGRLIISHICANPMPKDFE